MTAAILCVLAVEPLHAAAQPAQALATTDPARANLKGVWYVTGGFLLDPSVTSHSENQGRSAFTMRLFPPYRPEYEARYAAIVASNRAGVPGNDPGKDCLPAGVPQIMGLPFPFEIMVEPHRVTILFELESQVRRIWTDGRSHPAALDPTFNGYSIGHWEGDTLIVETKGFRDDTPFDTTGAFHSDKMVITERLRRISDKVLENRMTIADPVMFTGPWEITRTYLYRPELELEEYVCQENNRAR